MSHKIEHILVPVDFSETSEFAIYTAAAMAMLLKAELYFIHVMESNEYYFSVLPEAKSVMPPVGDIKAEAEKKMLDLQHKIKAYSGINATLFTTSGNIESEIRAYAKTNAIDLIVMGTHGISGYQEVFIGSNAQRLVTLSEIPVLTLKKEKDILGFKNILLPFDNDLHSREKVNIAIKIADLYSANIHILGVLDSSDPSDINKFKIKLKNVEDLMHEHTLPVKTTLIKGDNTAKAALEYAEANNCDLMVINTGHESRITGIFLGAFAQQMVNHANIPVLSIKPTEGTYSSGGTGSGV